MDGDDLPGDGGALVLFYHYEPVADVQAEVVWQQQTLTSLACTGRLRVAPAGINGTLSARRLADLKEYIAAVTKRFDNGKDIDWKISSICRSEDLFDRLNVRAVDEVVSLGVAPELAPLEATALHVSPADFHRRLQDAAASGSGDAVLLDVRNVYEHRIGRFELESVPTLLPPTRQFSDLPSWLDANLAELQGKKVFAYCTGGVRCESATAYLRHKGAALFSDIVQLDGGIERYLEAHPSGGFFRGRNHVFDKRLASSAAAPAERKLRAHVSLEFSVEAPHAADGGAGRRRAWLVDAAGGAAAPGEGAAEELGHLHSCVDGWEESLRTLHDALREHGPFDGLLGLSQGAAFAAALAATLPEPLPFRFVILCAGFVPHAPPALEALQGGAPIGCPSLHIVGKSDNVVPPEASHALLDLFAADSRRVVVEHDGGHVIPATDKHIQRYISFLAPFATPTMATPPLQEESFEPLPQRANRRRRPMARTIAEEEATAVPAAAPAASEPDAPDDAPEGGPASWLCEDVSPRQYEYLDHTADVQLHAWGATLEEAFEQQVVAMMGLITELETVEVDPTSSAPDRRREVCAEGHDLPSLLYNFLDEWLFQFNGAGLFVCRRVKVTSLDRLNWRIASVGVGEPFELGRHEQGIEVKAITYSALRVTEAADRTDLLVIVDI